MTNFRKAAAGEFAIKIPRQARRDIKRTAILLKIGKKIIDFKPLNVNITISIVNFSRLKYYLLPIGHRPGFLVNFIAIAYQSNVFKRHMRSAKRAALE
jgi:hypothetical protein